MKYLILLNMMNSLFQKCQTNKKLILELMEYIENKKTINYGND
jgi:hypothetical protein